MKKLFASFVLVAALVVFSAPAFAGNNSVNSVNPPGAKKTNAQKGTKCPIHMVPMDKCPQGMMHPK